MPSPEDMMYEDRQLKMKTRMWITLAFLGVSGITSVTYLVLHRPIRPDPVVETVPPPPVPAPLMSADECTKMCTEAGVGSYDRQNCVCKKPLQPVVGRMMCDCREITKEEVRKLNHY